MARLNRVGRQPYPGHERRRADLQQLRHAVEQAQALWRRLADLNADDPERPQLAARLDATQARVIALKLRHRL